MNLLLTAVFKKTVKELTYIFICTIPTWKSGVAHWSQGSKIYVSL